MPWPKIGATHHHARFGLPEKLPAIKWLVDCIIWDLEQMDALDGLALGCLNQRYLLESWPKVHTFILNRMIFKNLDLLS